MLVLLQAHGLTAGAICMIQDMFLLVVPTIVVCIWGVSVQSDGVWPYGCFRSVDACTPF